MALSAQNQSTSYVNLYYSIVQRAATRYFKEYYNSGEYRYTLSDVIVVIPHVSTHMPRTHIRDDSVAQIYIYIYYMYPRTRDNAPFLASRIIGYSPLLLSRERYRPSPRAPDHPPVRPRFAKTSLRHQIAPRDNTRFRVFPPTPLLGFPPRALSFSRVPPRSESSFKRDVIFQRVRSSGVTPRKIISIARHAIEIARYVVRPVCSLRVRYEKSSKLHSSNLPSLSDPSSPPPVPCARLYIPGQFRTITRR